MNYSRLGFAVVLAALAPASASAVVTFHDSLAFADASLAKSDGTNVVDNQIFGSASPAIGSVIAIAAGTDDFGVASASTRISILAQTASSGSIDVSEAVTLSGFAPPFEGGAGFRYLLDFTIDRPTVFSLNYRVTLQGNDLGSQPLGYQAFVANYVDGTYYGLLNPIINADGIFSVVLPASSYQFTVQDFYSLRYGPYVEGTRSISGIFDYSLIDSAPVPEPTAWLLMIVGFSISGLALRQERPAKTWVGVTA